MAFEIRLLPDDGWAAFRDIRLEGLRREPTAFGSSAELEEGFGDAWFQQTLRTNFVFAALRDGAIVGVAAWRRAAVPKLAHVGSVWGMYVRPSERGRGTGAALLRALIAHAAQSVEALKLSVVVDNGSAARLYDRCGFVPYGVEKRTLKVGDRYYDTELRMLQLRVEPDRGGD